MVVSIDKVVAGRWAAYKAESSAFVLNLPDNCIDAIVTDPPYGLRFMGNRWDYDVPSADMWKGLLRVLKPGGHLLSFFGTRTYHRGVVAIEDAGFEVRDMIQWIHAQGFPKSVNVAKAITDAVRGEPQGGTKPSSPNHGKYKSGCSTENEDGRGFGAGPGHYMKDAGAVGAVADYADEASQWVGYGTALKPAQEPIVVARKPLDGTIVANVTQYATGAINIDGCRIPGSVIDERGDSWGSSGIGNSRAWHGTRYVESKTAGERCSPLGRFPSNVIHDGSDEVSAGFPDSPGQQGDLRETGRVRPSRVAFGDMPAPVAHAARHDDTKSAMRFFYCAKPSRREKGEDNEHPTVKPVELMKYLVRLVTPTNGIVLDPFMGSGTTGVACLVEGKRFIGIDIDSEDKYISVAIRRLREAAASS